jgi:hypothetical protein
VKKLCALLVIGGLFALGCGGSTTTPKKIPTGGERPSPKEPPKGSPKETPVVKTPKIEALSAEGAAIAADKADATITIDVTSENVDGDITLKIDAPPELKVDKDTVTVAKGEKSAKVKVSVTDKAKRDKDEEYKLKVTATADKVKEPVSKDVTVKVLKKGA